MKIQQITRPHDFINVSSDFILKICRSKKTRVNIALSGGNTPQEIYQALAKKLSFMSCLPSGGPFKNQLHFYQVDERYIPTTDKDSNQKMITEAFTILKSSQKFSAKNIHFHFFDTSVSIEKSLKKYTKELPKIFDLMILGIGPDGHTASLFPNSKELNSKKPVVHSITRAHGASAQQGERSGSASRETQRALPIKNFTIPNRLTLTFPIILKSKNLLILLKNKPEILTKLKSHAKSKVTKTEISNFPALKLLSLKNLTIYSQN
ncbi:6-phosphogluconolactonase [Candidatus Peregrinibacteria bacterium]|nr:6-phosphogluconolactonase [Candidatus Peregrinibacteria bacterium]